MKKSDVETVRILNVTKARALFYKVLKMASAGERVIITNRDSDHDWEIVEIKKSRKN